MGVGKGPKSKPAIEGAHALLQVTTLMIVLLFDTNQLRQVYPGSLSLRLMAEASRRTGHRLAITDIVLEEAVRQRRDDLIKQGAALASSYQEFQKLIQPELRTMSAHPALTGGKMLPKKQAQAFEESLRQEFTVLETTPEDALEALKREAGHRPPCSTNGRGGRDTTIWLTAARASRDPDSSEAGRGLPVILVSEDKAFADGRERHSIASELRDDYPRPDMLLLAPTVVDALSLIGYPTEKVDAGEIAARIEFREALRDQILQMTSPTSGWNPGPGIGGIDLGRRLRRQAGTSRLEFPRLVDGRAQRSRNADLTLTTVVGTWRARVMTGEVSPEIREKHRSVYRGFPIRIACSALITQDPVGNVQGIDFSPITLW